MQEGHNPLTSNLPNSPSIVQILSSHTLELQSPTKNLATMETLPRSFPSAPTLPPARRTSEPEEAKQLSEGSSSGLSCYQNLQLMGQQFQSSRRKDEIQELSFTVKQILKSSEGYRRQLFQVYQGKASAKLESIVMKRALDGLKLQKQTWQLQRQKMQQLIDSYSEKQEAAKENQNTITTNVENQMTELEKELEFQKKRNTVLEVYNNELFTKLTSKHGQQSTLEVQQAREVELLDHISNLKLEQARLLEEARRYQREYESMASSYRYIKRDLESLQLELGNSKSNYKSTSGHVPSIKNDYESFSKQQLQKLQNKNVQIIERQRDIADLKRKLQEEKNNVNSTLKDNDSLRHSLGLLREEISLLKARPYRLEEVRPPVRETSLKEIQLEEKVAELNNILAHEKLAREHLGEELKKQAHFCAELENQREQLNEKYAQLEMQDNNKIIELSTLLLQHQSDIKELANNLKKSQDESQHLRAEIENMKKEDSSLQDSLRGERDKERAEAQKLIESYEIKILTNDAKTVDLMTQIRKYERSLEDERLRYQEARFLINKIELTLSQERMQKEEAQNNFKRYISEINQNITENASKFQSIIGEANQKTKLLENELILLNEACEIKQSDLNEKDSLIQRKSSVLDKLNSLIAELSRRIKNLQSENKDVRSKLEQETKYYDQSIQEANYKIDVLEMELKNVNAVSQHRKVNLEEQSALLQDRSSLLEQQNALIAELQTRMTSIEVEKRREKQTLRIKSQAYDHQIKQAEERIELLESELRSVNNISLTNQESIRAKDMVIANKETILEKLSLLIEDLNNKVFLSEESNQILRQNFRQLQLSNASIAESLSAKDEALVLKQEEIERIGFLLGLKQSEHEAEANILKMARSNSQNKLAKIQDQALQEVKKLQEEINRLKLTEKRFLAAEETLKNLSEEIKKSEQLWSEMSQFPPPNGIKKFINLMNSTHRVTFSREVEKMLEYFSRVEKCREELGKHSSNIKVIFNLIDQTRCFLREEGKQKKATR